MTDTQQNVFLFGKYRGETIHAIYSKDPSYLVWVLENKHKLKKSTHITTIHNIENFYKTFEKCWGVFLLPGH